MHCFCDGSSPEVITGIKQTIGKHTDYYHDQVANVKKNRSNPILHMKVLPMSFAKGGVSMLNQ